MKSRDFDFERAKGLMELIVEAGKHGPLYQKISGWAGEELKEMMREVEPDAVANLRVVTPAAGPANSLVEQADGSYKQVLPAPQPIVEPVALNPRRPIVDETRVPEAQPGMSIPTGNEALPADRIVPEDEAEPLVPVEPIDRRL